MPEPPPVPEPRDEPWPGVIALRVDVTDVERRIFRVRQTVPVPPGSDALVLLYPKWLPGFHAPQAPVELFAGLTVFAEGEPLVWKRHPTTINAFHIDLPGGVNAVEVAFQFLSPTDPSQGRVLCTADMLFLPWNSVLLYPAGRYARAITVAPELTLPRGWRHSCALDGENDGDTIRFAPAPLDTLVDSPVLAGRHYRRVPLDDQVHLTLVADRPDQLDADAEQIARHRAVVEQADRLFGVRHFDRFEMMLALSDELTSAGVEHHRSFEAVTTADYFADWPAHAVRRDTVPHEYIHSWNGKHRRGADSWQPSFEKPIRNSLLWVYEGLTQYWTNVLCARSGLWTHEQTLGALAHTAARYEVRPGSRWRPVIDTTRDPIIAARAPLPWASWQRSEDYYAEGGLIWLDVDMRLREATGDARSLDDFARVFFGDNAGSSATRPYRFEDVIAGLNTVAEQDWSGFFHERLTETHEHAPLAGLTRGGYRLAWRDKQNTYSAAYGKEFGQIDLTHSLGLTATSDGKLTDVLWEGPAFEAALTVGATIVAVGDRAFSPADLLAWVRSEGAGGSVGLTIARGRQVRRVTVACPHGLRYPHLEPITGGRPRLDDTLRPR